MNNPVFFFLRGAGRYWDFLFFFFHLFSMCSQVPKCVPQDVPNRIWVLSHLVCSNLSSPVYKLKRWKPKVYILFYFATWGSKRCFYWGACPMFQKLLDGPINMAPLKEKGNSCDSPAWVNCTGHSNFFKRQRRKIRDPLISFKLVVLIDSDYIRTIVTKPCVP
jgi:hypothetical protein